MKTLYLLRHAKAESGSSTIHDEDRPLSARGREACAYIAAHISRNNYAPDIVLCSSAIRTRETCERIQEALPESAKVKNEKKLYLATPGEMLTHIQAVDDQYHGVMLVGHNPGMHHLAATLANSEHTPLRMELDIKYPTGALAVITFNAKHWRNIAPDTGALVDFVIPKDLMEE
jgi:phosphohistidine phosphatase